MPTLDTVEYTNKTRVETILLLVSYTKSLAQLLREAQEEARHEHGETKDFLTRKLSKWFVDNYNPLGSRKPKSKEGVTHHNLKTVFEYLKRDYYLNKIKPEIEQLATLPMYISSELRQKSGNTYLQNTIVLSRTLPKLLAVISTLPLNTELKNSVKSAQHNIEELADFTKLNYTVTVGDKKLSSPEREWEQQERASDRKDFEQGREVTPTHVHVKNKSKEKEVISNFFSSLRKKNAELANYLEKKIATSGNKILALKQELEKLGINASNLSSLQD